MNESTLFKNLWLDINKLRIHFLTALVLYVPITILNVMQPVIIGWAVYEVMSSSAHSSVSLYGIIFLATVCALALCEYSQSYLLQKVGQTFIKDIRQKAFKKVQQLPVGFLDTMPLGKLLTRLTNDAESVMEMFSMGAVQIIGDCLFLGGTFVMLFFVDIKLSLVTSLLVPILALALYAFRFWSLRSYKKVREVLSSVNGFLAEYLSGLSVVQMSGRLRDIHRQFTQLNQQYLLANREAILIDAALFSFVDFMSYLGAALIVFAAFKLDYTSPLHLGILVAFIEALSRFFQPIREFSNRYLIFQSAVVSLERIYEMNSWPSENLVAGKKAVFSKEIEFSHVGFAYKEGEPVLHDVSFKVPRGQKVALVGRTGAGKSSVIKLLNRFYPPTKGTIFFDGHDIHEYSLASLRDVISVVPQEIFLFKGTVRDNLLFAKEVSEGSLWDALKLVQLEDVVRARGGLESIIEAGGVNWSLGERSLLALARALIKDPPILMLDEAYASVDSLTEKRLQMAIKNLLKDRTSVVIAHRLSTVVDCDTILVFHEGRIVEQGRHQELVAKRGVYANLIKSQEFGFS